MRPSDAAAATTAVVGTATRAAEESSRVDEAACEVAMEATPNDDDDDTARVATAQNLQGKFERAPNKNSKAATEHPLPKKKQAHQPTNSPER